MTLIRSILINFLIGQLLKTQKGVFLILAIQNKSNLMTTQKSFGLFPQLIILHRENLKLKTINFKLTTQFFVFCAFNFESVFIFDCLFVA